MSIKVGKIGETRAYTGGPRAYIELTRRSAVKFGEFNPANSIIQVLTRDQALSTVEEILKVFYSTAIAESVIAELDGVE